MLHHLEAAEDVAFRIDQGLALFGGQRGGGCAVFERGMRARCVCQREASRDRWLEDALCHGVEDVIRALTIFVDIGRVSRQTWARQEQRTLRVERSDLNRGRGPSGRAN